MCVLQELFQKEQQQLQRFFGEVDIASTEKLLQILSAVTGKIVLTGVGKSGLVAKKMAVTLTSTGTRALYLCPMDALHGDVGIVSDKDIVLMISKSGESEELLRLAPAVKNKGAKLVALVSNPESRLAKMADFPIFLPVTDELCPFNMAPTTSTVIQAIFGNVIAVALMRLRKFSVDDYAENHPAGRLGKRMTMKVKDLMLTGAFIPTCLPTQTLLDTLVELSRKRCGCVLVTDHNNHLTGIFTDGDLRRALQTHGEKVMQCTIEQLMTKNPKTIEPTLSAWEALAVMEDKAREVTVLPVVEEKRVVGLLKLHDILQAGL